MVTDAAEAVESELKAIDAVNWKRNKTTSELQALHRSASFVKKAARCCVGRRCPAPRWWVRQL